MDSEFPQGTVELWCQEQHEEGLFKGNSTIQQAQPQSDGDQANGNCCQEFKNRAR